MKKLEFREPIIWRSEEFKPSEVDASFVAICSRKGSQCIRRCPSRAGKGWDRKGRNRWLCFLHPQQDGSNISTTFADFPCFKRGFPMFDYRWVLGFSVPIASWGGELFRLLIEKVAVNWKTRFIWQRNIAYLKGYHIKIAFFQNKCCIF